MKLLQLFIISIFLSSCSSFQKDRLVKNINSIAHKEHNISHGELLAKYNLIGFSGKNTCLFAKNYGDIISNEAYNKRFIKHLNKPIDMNSIAHKIVSKISIIHSVLSNINAKYKIVAKSDLANLKSMSLHMDKISHSVFDTIGHSKDSSNHLANLARADKLIDDMPVFVPLTKPSLTSKFGHRKLSKNSKIKMHSGIDLAAANKYANIYASANGVVVEIAASPSYGNFILIEHKKNFKTRYAHLHKLFVSRGEKIFQGQVIGKQGSTGHSTNDHLHFEILYQNHPIDPMSFLGNEYSCRNPL